MKYIKKVIGLALIAVALMAVFKFNILAGRFMFLSGDGQVVPHTLLQLRLCLITLGIVGLYFIFTKDINRLLGHVNNSIVNLDRLNFLRIFILIALCLRVAVVIFMPFRLWIDYQVYDELARHWVEVGGYYVGQFPTAYRPPGYPFFLSRLYAIFGTHPQIGAVANIALSLAIMLISYLIIRRILNEGSARWTMVILAFFPSQLLFVNLLASEPLFTALFLTAVYIFILACRRRRNQNWYILAGGVFLGLATLTRAITLLYLIVPVVFWLAVTRTWRKTITYTLVALIGLTLVVSPWMIRNYRQKGKFTISTNRGINLLIGNQPGSGMGWNQPVTEEFSIGDPTREVYIDSVGWSRGIQYIESDPIGFVKRGFLKILYFYAVDMEGLGYELVEAADNDRFDRYVIVGLLTETYYIMILMFAFFGGLILLRRPRAAGKLLILLTIGYWTAVHFVFFADGRFHFPLIPFISGLAAIYIERMTGFTSRLRNS
nr:glycosyltransferase family 39 protein [candidate division Zixibacteria bacterium]